VKRSRWAALVAVALTACTSASSAPPRYGSSDRAAIVLRPADAPAGLAYVPRFSGNQPLGEFARDDGEAARLSSEGFRLGNGALFVPRDRADGGHLRAADPIVQGIAAVFSGDDGASEAFTRYLQDLRDRQLHDASDADAPPLGDESHRIDATNADGASVTVIGWRRSNLILIVVGTSFPSASVEALARLVDGRASRVA